MKVEEWLKKMDESEASLNDINTAIAIAIIERQREFIELATCFSEWRENVARFKKLARETLDMEV